MKVEISILGVPLQLLPEKAIYIEPLKTLLVADIHLGKSETFQFQGIPISNQVNQVTLDRLHQLCDRLRPQTLWILGDLFHSRYALVSEVLDSWTKFLDSIPTEVHLVVGNHDRALISDLQPFAIHCFTDGIKIGNLVLSHEPQPQQNCLNICGHIHPCIRIKTRLDNLRLPCFYLDTSQNLLMLPSFGEFTGGYDVSLKSDAIAYVVVDHAVIPFNA
ncbi:ligase-associated DNA damage response endonuclease PdeM [Leptothermofonsia sichuanensis E412]|uniref:ligase-associated DNA damage response endonuclease PdeM n=1 Tax=Leptothermofonsia sichuanensis TaxID=2917832 RepID=UPI001CA659EF|nr:ligase-associated DNA damage response endonuclease PdeM [Leptothermofonsia sichuanensis]QZZ20762.1 ligase-associated DNA damage response endonuclease PdeM [Leptothermofonsia sichuanensis E412]